MDDLRQAWERDGYVVLRGVAPIEQVAAYVNDLATNRDGLLVRSPGDEHASLATSTNQTSDERRGAVDPYALSPAARALLLPPNLVRFLTRDVFNNDAPLLFDADETAAGSSDDGPFCDATYVGLATEPDILVTATIALDAGAELTLFPGSQQISTSPFSGHYRHHNTERDGAAALQHHRDEITAALAPGHPSETITLNPSDALLWSADLVHTPVTGSALIAHLCPVRVQPSWFTYRPERARLAAHANGTAWIASQHYDLVDAVAHRGAPVDVQNDEPELERVEQALRAHDDSSTSQPPTPVSGRRGGGLVDSVRGLMNRRGRSS